jgi:hypothetical protein
MRTLTAVSLQSRLLPYKHHTCFCWLKKKHTSRLMTKFTHIYTRIHTHTHIHNKHAQLAAFSSALMHHRRPTSKTCMGFRNLETSFLLAGSKRLVQTLLYVVATPFPSHLFKTESGEKDFYGKHLKYNIICCRHFNHPSTH